MSRSPSRIRNYSAFRRFVEQQQLRFWRFKPTKSFTQKLACNLEITLNNLNLLQSFAHQPALRLAFASDFHAGPTTSAEMLAKACDHIRHAHADSILLGGDFVVLDAYYIDQLAEHFQDFKAPLGCYAVLGNHDLWVDYRYIESKLEACGIQVLINRNVRLPAPYDNTWICGFDDEHSGFPDSMSTFNGADGVRIVLMHAPSTLLEIGDERWEIALCGHTHGGQIALPGGFPLIVPHGKLSRRYCRGVHTINNSQTLVVSRGIGCSSVPWRLFSDPEVIVCTLSYSSHS